MFDRLHATESIETDLICLFCRCPKEKRKKRNLCWFFYFYASFEHSSCCLHWVKTTWRMDQQKCPKNHLEKESGFIDLHYSYIRFLPSPVKFPFWRCDDVRFRTHHRIPRDCIYLPVGRRTVANESKKNWRVHLSFAYLGPISAEEEVKSDG